MSKERRNHIKERARIEAREFSLIFFYAWVLLAVFAIHKSIILDEHNISYRQGFAIVDALVLAKVVFLAEKLHAAERFQDRPLVYPILFKSFLFSLLLVVFH